METTTTQISREDAEFVQQTRDNFAHFAEYVFPLSYKKGYKEAPHLIRWAERVQNHPKTATLSARKHLKSTLMYAYLAWRTFRLEEPEDWLYMSYTDTLSRYHTSNIKKLVRQNPFFAGIQDHTDSETTIKYSWNGQDAITITPASILRFNRGLHPNGGVVCDDILADPANQLNLTTITHITNTFFEEVASLPAEGAELHLVGCVSPETYIYTEEGIQKIGSLISYNPEKKALIDHKMKILGKEGWDKTKKFFVNGTTATKKIILENGYEIECSENHPLWYCPCQRWVNKKDLAWKRARDLKKGDFIALASDTQIYGKKPAITEDEAYLFGLWIAEGSAEIKGRANRITITNKDEYCLRFLKEIFNFNNTDGIHNRKNNLFLVQKMKAYGIKFSTAKEKEIPEKILTEPFNIQKCFLQGLFDGDGHSSFCQTTLQVRLQSASKKIIKTVQIMLLNMGILSSIHKTKKRSHLYKGKIISGGEGYCLNLSGHNASLFITRIGFRIAYKNKELKKETIKPEKLFGFIWKRIKKITDSESYTVDFIIPKTNSFITDGMVSHNTPQHAEDLFFQIKEKVAGFDWASYPAIQNETTQQTLWPEMFPYERLVQIRDEEIGEKAFMKEYLASPTWSEDAYFKREQLARVTAKGRKNAQGVEKWGADIIAGFDIGKVRHPSHIAIFHHDPTTGTWEQLYGLFLDGWDYTKQVELVEALRESFKIKRVYYDATRGELEAFAETGAIRRGIWMPVTFTSKEKYEMAANLARLVDTGRITLLDDPRQMRSMLAVTNTLEALETPDGHADAFFSVCMAVKKKPAGSPIIMGGGRRE